VNYVQRFHNRFRGGGLFDSHPLGSDAGGTPYVLADYVGSHLVEMKLRDIATMLTRVKKWKVTIDIEVDDGTDTDTLQTVITTPATVYERIDATWDGSVFDYSGSTVEVADEKALNIYNLTPFEYFNIQHEPSGLQGTGVTIEWSALFDYYAKTLSSADDSLKVTPGTAIYLPLDIEGSYFDDQYVGSPFSETIAFSFWTNIIDSSIDHDKADLTKTTSAVNIKFLGVDVTSDLYWIETAAASGTYDLTVSITIEPAATEAYWTYDGQFDEDTGAPV
jgi:hypothetical protein